MHKKRLIGWLAAAVTATVAATALMPAPAPVPAAQSARPEPAEVLAPHNSAPATLPARAPIGPSRGDLFSPRGSAPPKPPPVISAAPVAPAPPPMPYRVAGHVVHGSKAQVVLVKGDRVFTVEQGDVLDDGYRVESIESSRVTLVYTPLGAAQHLPLASSLVPQTQPALATPPSRIRQEQAAVVPGPARLHWEGPERVHAGTPFEVVLKLSSSQPVRSSPLELSYDAKLLEPVAVRAGDFFADRKFTYRVIRGGSISIGASNGEAPAADVDFLIVTFKPIRSGSTAELKLSAVELTDQSGEAVAQLRPPTFRTSIVQ